MRINDRRAFEREEKRLLDFARSYLSDAFPNPDRQGCPPDSTLRSLALNPSESEPTVTEHLAVCSPCFRRYMELLAQLKSQWAAKERPPWKRISAWSGAHPLLVGAALVSTLLIAIGTSLLLNRVGLPILPPLATQRAPNSAEPTNPEIIYSPFRLDLSNSSPIRGSAPPTSGSQPPVRVTSSPLNLLLTLPLGSEEQSYRVTLSTGNDIIWSKSATANLHSGQVFIQIEADFRQVPVGRYNLEVESSTGIRLTQPVLMEATLPKRTEQKP
jgi:hypothetical protein